MTIDRHFSSTNGHWAPRRIENDLQQSLADWTPPKKLDGVSDGGGNGAPPLAALRRENHDLRKALATRPVIDQAKGVLMLRYGASTATRRS